MEITKKKENGILNICCKINSDFSLFRMRSCNDYNLEALIKEEIWATCPRAFNDPYDTYIACDEKKVAHQVLNYLNDKEDLLEFLMVNSGTNNRRVWLSHYVHNFYQQMNETFRRTYVIACFTMDICNEIMWAHYAESSRGFALEYNFWDLKDLGEISDQSLRETFKKFNFFNLSDDVLNTPITDVLLPVEYKNDKYNATELLGKIIIDVLELYYNAFKTNQISMESVQKYVEESQKKNEVERRALFQNAISPKKKIWSYEKEWRLIANNSSILSGNIDSNHCLVGTLKPKAIYLGEFIAEHNKVIILDYAKKNNIPVYQMYSVITPSHVRLKYKLIKE